MCFLPKSRASMDQAPGPIIAKVAPRIANMIEMSGLLECEKTIHVSTTALRVPATGVHKPRRSSIPAAAPIMEGANDADWDRSLKAKTPQIRSAVPVINRWKRRPTPGQPPAKLENSRCNRSSPHRVRGLATGSERLKVGTGYPTFGGYAAR